MASIGFVLHPERPDAAALAGELVAWLVERGHDVRLTESDASRCGHRDLGCAEEELAPGLDLMVGLGGDGTVLQAADRAVRDDVAVLGINMGQLGYLTTVEPAGARVALKRFLAGAFELDERMRVQVEIVRPDGSSTVCGTALNEALLERAELGHTVRLAVDLDGEPFTSYVADGLIVATPTGSTAYALSARGPILDPSHRAQLLVPVSPHMLFDRALVLEASSRISMTVVGTRPAHLSLDGRSAGEVVQGEVVTCAAATRTTRLVRFGPPSFHRVLREKFGLSDR